jgi:hypothetical protein
VQQRQENTTSRRLIQTNLKFLPFGKNIFVSMGLCGCNWHCADRDNGFDAEEKSLDRREVK